jgi:subtilisin family serine protease
VGVFAVPVAAQPSTTSVIVIVDHGASPDAIGAAVTRVHGGHVGHVYDHVLGGFQLDAPAGSIGAIGHTPGVRAVVPDQTFRLSDVAGTGFFRIGADVSVNDSQGPYRGASTRIATIDSGIDTTHPDLAPHLDLAHSYNCVGSGVPEDDNGHGTHVAGIAAAVFNSDGFGIVGVAPEASIVALKAFDANGNGSTSAIVCALDHLAQVTTSAPMPTVVNMSFGDTGTDSQCHDSDVTDVLHDALCAVVDAGTAAGVPVIPVAAAGNDNVDASNTIPAAFHDVITVSAYSDADGKPGALAGCPYIAMEFNWECDDTIASFSNWGSVISVTAPGVDIYSDYPPNDFASLSGTSMAAPHVSGVIAEMLGTNPKLDTASARTLLQQTGECPDGTEAGTDASCSGQGQWQQTANQSIFDPVGTRPDPDGIAEPLVNADRAARAAQAAKPATVPGPPTIGTAVAAANQATVGWTAPTSDGGSPITGYVVTPYVGYFALSPTTFTSTATTETLTGLVNGTTYRFKVAAINAIGTGPTSRPSNPVTPATVPTAPTIGTAIAGNAVATVSWTTPASNGGSPITGYVVTAYVGYTPVRVRIFISTSTTQTITGLTNATTYRFRVQALNAIGLSTYSKASNPVTPSA